MRKIKNEGFMLAETLIVTAFVSGVLLFLFIQFTNLNKNYNYSYKYNTVEDLYATEDIKNYIKSDSVAVSYIESNIVDGKYKEITDCSIFSNKNYCEKLFELEKISEVFVTNNDIDYNLFEKSFDENFVNFVKRIKQDGDEKYRLLIMFNNSTYSTIKF